MIWTIISFILYCATQNTIKKEKERRRKGEEEEKEEVIWILRENAFTFEFGMLVRHYVQMFRSVIWG